MRRNILAEIEDIRERATAVEDLDNGIMRILFLAMQADSLMEESELNAYFIVASIAALESYFRWQIRTLIDSADGRYLSNVRIDDLQIKFNLDVAVALAGRRVTVGELVAHSVGFSSFERVAGFMSRLLGTEFVSLVKNANEPTSRTGNEAPRILSEGAKVISDVKRTLALRHMICHEANPHMIEASEVKELCHSCSGFVRASYYGISHFLNPDAPLDLASAYRIASEKERSLSDDLRDVEAMFAAKLSPPEREVFEAMQQSWSNYVAREADFFASVQMNGNRGQYDALMARARLNARRIEELQKWYETVYPKVPIAR